MDIQKSNLGGCHAENFSMCAVDIFCGYASGYRQGWIERCGPGYYTSFYPEEIIKPFFNIPVNYKLICVTPIGVPDEWPPMPPKKELKETVVYDSF